MAPEFDRNLVRANLLFSYSVFDGGSRSSRIQGAESGRAQAGVGEESARMDLLVSVIQSYLEVLSSVDLLEAAEGQRQALAAEEARVQQFLEEGKAARVDLLRVQAALSQAQASEISLGSGLSVAQGRLSRLTGVMEESVDPRALAPVQLHTGEASASLAEAMDRARAGSPELRFAQLRVVGAEAGVREAKAQWLPKLEAAGGYSDFGSLEGGHTLEWQGSLRVSFPLFTGGARKGALDQARAEERGAREALRKHELAVEQSVQEAVSSVVEARALREAFERGVEQTEEVARIEALALEVGSGVQTDFLRAQAELFQARAALVQARHREVLAAVSLARISGDLSQSWIEENLEVSR
jgi:outer membrane protein TolC